MNKVSFLDKFISSGSVPIHFIVCKDSKGRLAHYFIMSSHQKLKLMREAKEGVLELAKYGHILASGFGREPSLDMLLMLEEKYNYNFS